MNLEITIVDERTARPFVPTKEKIRQLKLKIIDVKIFKAKSRISIICQSIICSVSKFVVLHLYFQHHVTSQIKH